VSGVGSTVREGIGTMRSRAVTHRLALVVSIGLLLGVAVAGPARATTVAAWDFSQYAAPGFLTTDNVALELTQTLDANYSDLDPNAMGSPADQFGTMFLDGSLGSSVGTLTGPIIPNGNDLTANNDVLDIDTVFLGSGGSFNVLKLIEGQENTMILGLGAVEGNSSVVFQADLTTAGLLGEDWVLSLGGQNRQGGTGQVNVEFSTDGASFESLDPFEFTGNESVFTAPTTSGPTEQAFFRLTFLDGIETNPTIDNVGISATMVPEPGAELAAMAGLIGLVVVRLRRIRGV